ncbi:MAG: AAA family ATPase [Chloroflexota bacterium]
MMATPIHPSTPTFRRLIEGGYLYVDKTPYIYELIKELGGVYFISRPRRFGKSLLVSTLDEIFQGNKELFEDLWLAQSDYQWENYPVIRIDFSEERVETAVALKDVIDKNLTKIATKYGITLDEEDAYNRKFIELIEQLRKNHPDNNRVVILIDEYDAPIIDNLENVAEVHKIRRVMKAFYSVIKAMDADIRFVLITGISKFTKVSIFSELNHLRDLTLRNQFATMLGLTIQEIRDNFADHIREFAAQEDMTEDELMEEIRYWYNGFCFAPNAENVYNPFSTVQLFTEKEFDNYWFESGTPTFLIELIHKRNYPIEELNNLTLMKADFETYDVDDLDIVPLLFQTGYLTLKGLAPNSTRRMPQFELGYPNHEVKTAFLRHLLNKFSNLKKGRSGSNVLKLMNALHADDLEQFFRTLKVFFASIQYDLHLPYEKYYQSILYLALSLMGEPIDAEVQTSEGRIDTVINLDNHIYLFEFKINKTAQEAMDQIHDKKYYEPYLLENKPITLIGANFSSTEKAVDDWISEQLAVDS